MISSGAVLVVAAVIAILVVAAIVLLVLRARRSAGYAALPGANAAPGGYVCPFCKRPYDPEQTGGRCPSCGAAAPRR